MFCNIFGDYLVKEGILTQNQLSAVIDYLQTIRVKLGFIAIAEKMLTQEQVSQINLMQSTMDQRFGDIAIKKGDLTKDQVQYLLSLQGNPYLQFVQAITDLGYLSLAQIDQALKEYQEEFGYTKEELEALKSSDIDRVADVLVKIEDKNCDELAHLCLRNINRFISTNFYLGKAYKAKVLQTQHLALQWVKGEIDWFLAFDSDTDGMLAVSNLYANEFFQELSEDAIDSVQEFINCTNGLHATKLSHIDIIEELEPPVYYENHKIVSEEEFYIVPIVISGKAIKIIVAVNAKITA